MSIWSKIAVPFGMLLLWLYQLTHNYGVAIILFALIVKIILLPFQMKSKRSMMRMSRFTPKLKELEKKYEGNQQKYQEEMAKLYKQEGISPMSGCLWSLIPFPILIALYQAIRYPLTIMMRVPGDRLAEGGAIAGKLTETGFSSTMNAGFIQIPQSQWITAHWNDFAGLSDKLVQLNYKFLGMDLGSVPQWNFFSKVDWSSTSSWLPALGLFLIPIISAAMSYLSMVISNKANPQTDQQQNSMKSMMLFMPLISIWICFTMPAALGIYWIMNSVLAIVQDVILTKYYNRVLDIEDADRLAKEKTREAELERKREETERLKAAGETVRNPNTSKRKIQAKEKAQSDERVAAVRAAEKAERRAKLGIPEEETPESQVGNRRYARGRAYVADRYGAGTGPAAEPAEDEPAQELPAPEEAVTALPAEAVSAPDGETAAELPDEQEEDEEFL